MMSTTIIVAVIAAAGLVVVPVITAVLGPIVYPWYSERMSKAQLRVRRRMTVRTMIESELSKGIYDLGAIAAYLMALLVQTPATAQDAYIQNIINNEVKFGVWLGYSIEDARLRALCEGYRDLIRDIRVVASQPPPPPPDMEVQLGGARKDADQKATEIIRTLNSLDW